MVANLGKGQPNLTDVEISALGKLIYRQNIRPLMTEEDIGKYVIVDVYSGEYEVAENMLDATHKLKSGFPTPADSWCVSVTPLPYSWGGTRSRNYDHWQSNCHTQTSRSNHHSGQPKQRAYHRVRIGLRIQRTIASARPVH